MPQSTSYPLLKCSAVGRQIYKQSSRFNRTMTETLIWVAV